MEKKIVTDCAVIGSGAAGCTAALELADAGMKVDLFTKGTSIENTNSYYIAGGFAAVPPVEGSAAQEDSFAAHIEDTMKAGAGLNDRAVVEYCIKHFYPEVVKWLIDKGVPFDQFGSGDRYDLHKEGGHSANRVFHISDKTGIALMQSLEQSVKNHPNITLHINHVAIDFIRRNKLNRVVRNKDVCLGCYVYDVDNNYVKAVAAKGVFVATGGLGKVFLYTSNPDVATGDGFALCYRARLPLVNMEFIQFHPTVFYDPTAVFQSERRVLFTEALRGEGAILKLRADDDEDFVLKYDPVYGSNSSRDIVTRAEDIEMRKHGLNHLWLDCTKIGQKKLKKEYNAFYEFCREKGINPDRESVPVIYAIHYSNGGVLVNMHGETVYGDGTGLARCYVLGETAYTGLHGATRLASNSGPEAVLFARLAAKHFVQQYAVRAHDADIPVWSTGRATESRDRASIDYCWDTIRDTMTRLCGISRNERRLNYAKAVLSSLDRQVDDFYWNYFIDNDALEVRNILDVAISILDSALLREESRACHFREDFAGADDKRFHGLTVVRKGQEAYLMNVDE